MQSRGEATQSITIIKGGQNLMIQVLATRIVMLSKGKVMQESTTKVITDPIVMT